MLVSGIDSSGIGRDILGVENGLPGAVKSSSSGFSDVVNAAIPILISKGISGGLRGKGLSGYAALAKRIMVESEGSVTRSEIYLTNIDSGESIQLCMTPEKIKARTESNFRSYSIVERGEVKIPKGERLAQVSWRGILPGARILLYNFVTHAAWEPPKEIINTIKRWRDENAKVKLLITQTPINMDVYIKSFDYEMSGGQGNYEYDIDFLAAKDLQILTVEEADAKRQQDAEKSQQALNTRAQNKSRLGMRISKFNNVWAITKILTGRGSMGDWEQVMDTNGIDDPTGLGIGDVLIWN